MNDTTPVPTGHTGRIALRASPEQIAQWKEAAWIRRVSLSEWMRQVLTATAQATKEAK